MTPGMIPAPCALPTIIFQTGIGDASSITTVAAAAGHIGAKQGANRTNVNSQRNAPPRRALLFQRLRSRIVRAIPQVPANVLQLPILGIAVGVTASLVVVSFKATIAFAEISLVGPQSEDFESLPAVATALLPLIGAVVIGVLLTRMVAEDRRTGIAHVLERLGSHEGQLPVKNALVQFFAGAGSLAAGLSGGRESPAIHLGAATSSILGQAFKLPNHRIRLLVACGAAAATAASFHTPVAAIVFAMEVVMMQWAIGCLIPVILAVAAATVVSRTVFLHAPDLVVPHMGSPSMLDLVYMAFGGFAIGAIAAGFILAVRFFAGLDRHPFLLRATIAGAITACAAFIVPAVMGVGYDTINVALAGQLILSALLLIVVAKTIASAACIGLGIPVGVIGPTLVIGAACGGILAHLSFAISPESAASPAFYVMLGMVAMFAATLRAPLAALMVVLELTLDSGVMLPAMLIVIIATRTTRSVFRQRSVFLTMLSALELDRLPSEHLLLAPVGSIMERSIVRLPDVMDVRAAAEALAGDPEWVVVEGGDGNVRCLLKADDLARHLRTTSEKEVHLMLLSAERKDALGIDIDATLRDAQEVFARPGIEALYVQRPASGTAMIGGILTRAATNAHTRTATRAGHR